LTFAKPRCGDGDGDDDDDDADAISTGSIGSPVGMRLEPLSVIQRLLKSGC
jgi:hypothetical protein